MTLFIYKSLIDIDNALITVTDRKLDHICIGTIKVLYEYPYTYSYQTSYSISDFTVKYHVVNIVRETYSNVYLMDTDFERFNYLKPRVY